jgi:hypothetical protein
MSRVIEEEMKGKGEGIVLDLEEVTLVDLDVVRFLGEREAKGAAFVKLFILHSWIGFSGERKFDERD